MKLFLKQRNIYYMKYWCLKVSDVEISKECCEDALKVEGLSRYYIDILTKEKEVSQQLLDEYLLFIDELDEVERAVLLAYVYDKPIPPSMNEISYERIKIKVFKKWCFKFMNDNLIYVHELDVVKLGKIIKEAREKKYYSINSVAEFLGLTESSLRNYESGRRTPSINVLYALCELYDIKIVGIIKEVLK